jgi:hypothetical protein
MVGGYDEDLHHHHACVVILRLSTAATSVLLFIPRVIYERGEPWRNDVDWGKKVFFPPERSSAIPPAEPPSSKSGGSGRSK